MANIWIDGLVAQRNGEPRLQISSEKGIVAQMSMAEARKIAMDILQMSARTEADAMIVKFFQEKHLPLEAASGLLVAFRDFRHRLDMEEVEGSFSDPDTGEQV